MNAVRSYSSQLSQEGPKCEDGLMSRKVKVGTSNFCESNWRLYYSPPPPAVRGVHRDRRAEPAVILAAQAAVVL